MSLYPTKFVVICYSSQRKITSKKQGKIYKRAVFTHRTTGNQNSDAQEKENKCGEPSHCLQFIVQGPRLQHKEEETKQAKHSLLAALEFELRASHLLGRHSTT
jgi:hypothetical protein